MSTYRIRYRGPAELAVDVATLLADAEGVELTGSDRPEQTDGGEAAVLALTVEGSESAVDGAVRRLRDRLPGDATLAVDPG